MPNTSGKSWIKRDNLTEIKNCCPSKSVQVAISKKVVKVFA